MPVYEYQCKNCSHEFELRQSFNDIDSAVTCPQCNAAARRIFSPIPIIFKGPGFYVTDHSAKSKSDFSKRRDGGKPADTARRNEPAKKTEPAKENKEKDAS